MNLHLNHTQRDSAAAAASEAVGAVLTLLEERLLDSAQFARLQIYLDWLQYKQNFREPVMVSRMAGGTSGGAAMEIRIDSRQIGPGSLRQALHQAVRQASVSGSEEASRVYLEDFRTFRESVVWDFNRLYWQRLKDWEQITGRPYEQSLPGGQSDGHLPGAIAESVEEFWKLAQSLDAQGQLPPELFIVEIGVGLGTRAGLWLDRMREVDDERGTNYYPRIRFLLGDYSLSTLERSRPAVKRHIDLCSFIALDALDPLKTLSFLRHKILHVHSTNTYDNLPDEELVWRDSQIFWVQVRAYVPAAAAARISGLCEIGEAAFSKVVNRLIEVGPECLADRAKGMAFWMETWKALRLEERLVSARELPDVSYPAGLSPSQLEDILNGAPNDLRFHLSSGALESFRNTLPLLHPRGYLQVQDIFVKDLNEYSMGFHGPGKLDGSIVNWVNGALLREVAERSGYDIHFAPFRHRPGSKTSVLYTTQRE